MFKKCPSDKINVTKNKRRNFFLARAPTHHIFIFNLQFLHKLKPKLRLFKSVWIFHFRIHLVFIKVYILVQQKSMDTLTLKRNNSFQN